ncbi:YafY family transcriptional regulator [Suttonella sp. R2A3]|uniref:helix-turn-helix transcriptional regulator n=1 Tax=Suttonella sp. R2A3 TaxID=2908648 RepID=UPI001F2CA61C|nr:YafY family protein [Suttonella sp. R2A3]UJF24143.1 YafY family transcriptional regulator [Suttonella sp. R2A3]
MKKSVNRTERLFALLHILRHHRRPISAERLAEQLSVSTRTLYRDINTLRLQGADIQGEAGLGFILKERFTLPPLMFTPDEIEALVLGGRWVNAYGDDALTDATRSALAKIRAVSSKAIVRHIDAHTLFVPPVKDANARPLRFAHTIRNAIREQHKIQLYYENAEGSLSDRVIYPFALAFFGTTQMIAAWCEQRADFRHFRVDRILALTELCIPYTPNKQTLLTRWRRAQNIDDTFDQV